MVASFLDDEGVADSAGEPERVPAAPRF